METTLGILHIKLHIAGNVLLHCLATGQKKLHCNNNEGMLDSTSLEKDVSIHYLPLT